MLKIRSRVFYLTSFLMVFVLGLSVGLVLKGSEQQSTESKVVEIVEIKEVATPLTSSVTGEVVDLDQTVINELGAMPHALEMAEKIHSGFYAIVNTAPEGVDFPDFPSALEIALEIRENGHFDHAPYLR